jgi:TfoX/Sxy family transcriptional regulator of competence genes
MQGRAMGKADLVERVREALADLPVTEQKMFGGVCFMLNGNMLVGASPRGLMVRVGKDGHAQAVARPHAKPMEQGGRTMAGYVVVDNEGVARKRDLDAWLALAVSHVGTLPPKEKKAPSARTATKPASGAGRKPA